MTAPSRLVADAARRWADRNRARTAAVVLAQVEVATVTDVTAGAAQDGNATVTVTAYGATTVVEGYLASYTPAISDRVLVAVKDAQWIILGPIVGQP